MFDILILSCPHNKTLTNIVENATTNSEVLLKPRNISLHEKNVIKNESLPLKGLPILTAKIKLQSVHETINDEHPLYQFYHNILTLGLTFNFQ